MNTWGDPINPVTYDPATDPGLWYIPDDEPCTEPDITASLNSRGYSVAQIDTLMNGPGGQWTNRTAVMVGLAEWTGSGPGDTSVDNAELTWVPYPPYQKNWTWRDYLGWASEANSKLTKVHPEFRFRFGVKTYVDFLLDRKDHFSQTDLTHTPEEPLRSVKDGVQAMVDMTRSFDQMSLEVFGSTGHHEIDLSHDRQAVADRLYQMQANYYDNSTNIGAGLQQAINELTGPRARAEALKTIVLMGDGANRTGPDPISVAQDAADQGIRIYTVSVGFGADRSLMQEIASIGDGQEFYAYGTPEEYTLQLQVIFRTIGGLGVPALIE